jgi:hypothetical protein
MIEENLSAFRRGLRRAKLGTILWVAVAFMGDVGGFGSSAEAAILYDAAAVSPSRFLLGENGVAKGLTISVAGVRLPFNPDNPLRSVAFEIVQINSDPLNVAIALTEVGTGMFLKETVLTPLPGNQTPRMLLGTIDVKNGLLATKLRTLNDPGRAVVATICSSLTDPIDFEAAAIVVPAADRPKQGAAFAKAVRALASECQSALANLGTVSAGFVSRAKVSERLLKGADGLVSAKVMGLNNWVGNASDKLMSGTIASLLTIEVAGATTGSEPVRIDRKGLLWDGHLASAEQRRLALYGRVSQYPGAPGGLFDNADGLALDLRTRAPLPRGFDAAIKATSRESLLLLEHLLTNLAVLRAVSAEATNATGLTVNNRFSPRAAVYWSAAVFGDDASGAIKAVSSELFRRAFPDQDKVSKLQAGLKAWGFYEGDIDGQAGLMTIKAFQEFERMISGASNSSPSGVESQVLAMTPTGNLPLPTAQAGSLAEMLVPQTGRNASAEQQQSLHNIEAESQAMEVEIAALALELERIDAGTADRIRARDALLADCYCQGGRLCK